MNCLNMPIQGAMADKFVTTIMAGWLVVWDFNFSKIYMWLIIIMFDFGFIYTSRLCFKRFFWKIASEKREEIPNTFTDLCSWINMYLLIKVFISWILHTTCQWWLNMHDMSYESKKNAHLYCQLGEFFVRINEPGRVLN